MIKKTYYEKPFEYLKRKDGSEYSEETVNNWYKARSYVLDKLKDIAYTPDSKEHLHVVVCGDSDLMLAVVRQVVLSAHYINFREYNEIGEMIYPNRTVITLVSDKNDIETILNKEENLNNLLTICGHKIHENEKKNTDSFMDIELEVVDDVAKIDDNNAIKITESEVQDFVNSKLQDEIYNIDTRKAILAGRVYGLGGIIGNLPAEDIHSAHRYTLALNVFKYKLMKEKLTSIVNEPSWNENQLKVKNSLSDVFCADCFESRLLAIKRYCKSKKIQENEAWEANNEALSISEHARWIAEKLIMGFRCLDDKEHLKDESLFGKNKKQYRDSLKKNRRKDKRDNNIDDFAHIDLCSYHDLRRINPDDMKYDSFLMLAIPEILEKINKDDKKWS